MNFRRLIFVSAVILVTATTGVAEQKDPVKDSPSKESPKAPIDNSSSNDVQISNFASSVYDVGSQISTHLIALQSTLKSPDSKISNVCFFAGELSASLLSMTQLEPGTLSLDQGQVKPGFEVANRQIQELQKRQYAVAEACGGTTGVPLDVTISDLKESFEKTELLSLIDQDLKVLIGSIQELKQNPKSTAANNK